jgi:hypothetical protein
MKARKYKTNIKWFHSTRNQLAFKQIYHLLMLTLCLRSGYILPQTCDKSKLSQNFKNISKLKLLKNNHSLLN